MYIPENLTNLVRPEIPLTIPTLHDNILINSPALHEPRQLHIQTIKPGSQFEITRPDGMPLQVTEADERKDNFGHELLSEPVRRLGLTCLNKFTWQIDVDESDVTINDTYMMREFIGILSGYAWSKQRKLEIAERSSAVSIG